MIPNPWVIVGALVAAIGLAVGGYFYGHHVESLAFDAYRAQQAAVAQKAEADAQAAARAAEQNYDSKLADATAAYQENLDALTKRRDALERQLADGSQRVYVTVARPRGNGVPETAASAGRTDQAVPAALSQRSAEFFAGEFAEADQLVGLVNLAEQVIAQDRQTCNGDAK